MVERERRHQRQASSLRPLGQVGEKRVQASVLLSHGRSREEAGRREAVFWCGLLPSRTQPFLLLHKICHRRVLYIGKGHSHTATGQKCPSSRRGKGNLICRRGSSVIRPRTSVEARLNTGRCVKAPALLRKVKSFSRYGTVLKVAEYALHGIQRQAVQARQAGMQAGKAEGKAGPPPAAMQSAAAH